MCKPLIIKQHTLPLCGRDGFQLAAVLSKSKATITYTCLAKNRAWNRDVIARFAAVGLFDHFDCGSSNCHASTRYPEMQIVALPSV
jgi:hypothetical protein